MLQDELPDDLRDLRRVPVGRDQRGEVQPRPDQVAPRDRRRDVPEVADDDDAARDPAAQVEEIVVVVGAPLAEDSAEQELPAHLQRPEPLLIDQRVVVGIVPLLVIGVAVDVGVGRPEIGADGVPLRRVREPVPVGVRAERIALNLWESVNLIEQLIRHSLWNWSQKD